MASATSESGKFEFLKEDNYYGWKANMEAALKYKDLWGPVVQSDECWSLDDVARRLDDDKARSLMVLCISPTLKTLISDCDTAKAACDVLARVFHSRSAGRKFSLRSELHDIRRGKSEGVLSYLSRAEKIRAELKAACNEDVADDVMVHAILRGLGKSYDAFVRQLQFSTEELSLSGLKGRLLSVEGEIKKVDLDRDAVALV